MDLKTITLNIPVSQMRDFMDIVSKHNWQVVSKTEFNPISIAKNAPGADEIEALAGAFSSCTLNEDWKTRKYC